MNADGLYLLHIDECIRRIETYAADGQLSFLSDTRTQDAVLRNLQVLGESSKRLSSQVTNRFPKTNWKGIAGFRNVLVHDYLGVRMERVWQVLTEDLPPLKLVVRQLLNEYGIGSPDKKN